MNQHSDAFMPFPVGQTASFRKAFALQYIAIILIVLTFVIGAFARQKSEQVAAQVTTQVDTTEAQDKLAPKSTNPVPKPLGSLELSDAFVGETSDLNPDALRGVVAFLKYHDTRIRVEIPQGRLEYSLAVSRSIALYKFLLAEGVPAQAAMIYATSSDERTTITLEFLEETEP